MNSTCPGQAALIPDAMPKYMRVACMTFWENAMPDMTVFYLHEKKVILSYQGIKSLETDLAAIMRAEDPTFLYLKYVGYEMVGMTEQDIQEVGSFFVVGLGA